MLVLSQGTILQRMSKELRDTAYIYVLALKCSSKTLVNPKRNNILWFLVKNEKYLVILKVFTHPKAKNEDFPQK